MAENNYGAPDPSQSPYNHNYSDPDYAIPADMYGAVPSNEALYWEDINKHFPAVMAEDPESITTAAGAWRVIADSFRATATAIRTKADELDGKWDSPQAKEAFLLKVGYLTASLDEWAGKADTNGAALETLQPVVEQKRRDMKTLWEEYDQKARDLVDEDADNSWGGDLWGDITDRVDGKTRHAENLERYSRRSREEILTPLETAYDTAAGKMSTGSNYQGMTDSAMPGEITNLPYPGGPGGPSSPGAPGAPGGVGAPGAPSIGAPGSPGAAPMAPSMMLAATGMRPFMPQAPPAPPAALSSQALQSYQNAMRDVDQHLARMAPPEAPGSIPHSSFMAPPAAPGVLGRTGPAPAAPGSYSPGSRANGIAGRAAPAAPNVSRTGAPTAPGSAGAGGPGGLRPAAPGVPGGLGGRNGAPPAAPGSRAGGRGPAAPSLGGRGAPKAPTAPSRSGLGAGAPTLGGRNARPGAPGSRAPGAPLRPGAPGAPGANPAKGVPGSLQGRPTSPGARPAGGARPGMPGSARPGAPRPGTPSLGGRTTPTAASRQANVAAARSALRKSLAGRPASAVPGSGSAASTRGARPPARTTDRLRAQARAASSGTPAWRRPDRKRDEEDKALESSLVGGTELFEANVAGDGVVAAREASGPVKRSGPAIGASRD